MANNKRETYEDFGTRLKVLLKKKGKTEEWLAVQVNVSSRSISNYISGRSNPRAEDLLRISELLDVSCDYLLKGYDKCQNCQTYQILTEENSRKLQSKDCATRKKICDLVNLLVEYMVSRF